MRRATITEAKNGLSSLIDRVKGGETILITDRGVPVARLAPAAATAVPDDEGRLARLERTGVITRGSGEFRTFLERPLVETVDSRGIVDLVLEERGSGW